MTNKKRSYVLLLILIVIIIGIILLYLNVTNIPSSEGKVVVKHFGGQGMLIAECANLSYVEETSDYIIEGEVISTESKWVQSENGGNIYTYSDFKINNYIKGEPLEYEMIQIVTDGGCVGVICQSVEDGPIITTGEKRLYITISNGEFAIHGCGGIATL